MTDARGKTIRERDFKRVKATAYHEVGHAVVRWWLGLRFKEASIIPNSDEGSLGHVSSEKSPKWFNHDEGSEMTPRVQVRIQREITASFAGQIAEGKFRRRVPRWGMHSDNQIAVDMATHIVGGGVLDAYLHFLWLRSRTLVNTRWWEIQFVADALIKERG